MGGEQFNAVTIWFGTDRKSSGHVFGPERGTELVLGHARVTIPKSHNVAAIERPWDVTVLNRVLYRGAEDPRKHFTISKINQLGSKEFQGLVQDEMQRNGGKGKIALIFIHGYQVAFEGALFRTAPLAFDLQLDGVPFLYSWPSGNTLSDYLYDMNSAKQSEPHLRKFLELVVGESGASKIVVIAHSMGYQPLLGVLREMRIPDFWRGSIR